MINLMNDNNLMELEIEKEGMRIKLRKSGSEIMQSVTPIIPQEVVQAKGPTHAPGQQIPSPAAKNAEIKSPMVGTFYRAPSPEADEYVAVGQNIEPGQVICIIEAMKLMNEIKAEIKGKITEILLENAEPVEFGQPLFLIDPL